MANERLAISLTFLTFLLLLLLSVSCATIDETLQARLFKPGFEVYSWKSRKISLEIYRLEVFQAHRRVILSASNPLVSLR